jgi:hypothetical protein
MVNLRRPCSILTVVFFVVDVAVMYRPLCFGQGGYILNLYF